MARTESALVRQVNDRRHCSLYSHEEKALFFIQPHLRSVGAVFSSMQQLGFPSAIPVHTEYRAFRKDVIQKAGTGKTTNPRQVDG
jgi:hypothetical protein